jgi:hypothetical protein
VAEGSNCGFGFVSLSEAPVVSDALARFHAVPGARTLEPRFREVGFRPLRIKMAMCARNGSLFGNVSCLVVEEQKSRKLSRKRERYARNATRLAFVIDEAAGAVANDHCDRIEIMPVGGIDEVVIQRDATIHCDSTEHHAVIQREPEVSVRSRDDSAERRATRNAGRELGNPTVLRDAADAIADFGNHMLPSGPVVMNCGPEFQRVNPRVKMVRLCPSVTRPMRLSWTLVNHRSPLGPRAMEFGCSDLRSAPGSPQ